MTQTLRNRVQPQKYVALANQLRREIKTEGLRPGDRLPSLVELRRLYGASQATADKAHALLEEEGLIVREPNRGVFVSSPKRRSLKGVIGVVSAYIARNHPYYANLLKGIQDASHHNGLEVLLLHESSAVNRDRVDGVLVQGVESFSNSISSGLPCVSMVQEYPGMPSVTTNDPHGIRDAMGHLLAQGHRRIGYLTAGALGSSSPLTKNRVAAYREALQGAGINPDPSWIRNLDAWEIGQVDDGFRGLGRRRMNDWLQDGWATLGCTALLAQNDDTAIGMIEALLAAGYRVPRDVSVVGFDGTERADYFSPRLTTIALPLESMSRCSVDLLSRIVQLQYDGMDTGSANSIVLPTSLRLGDSTGPPPRDGN